MPAQLNALLAFMLGETAPSLVWVEPMALIVEGLLRLRSHDARGDMGVSPHGPAHRSGKLEETNRSATPQPIGGTSRPATAVPRRVVQPGAATAATTS